MIFSEQWLREWVNPNLSAEMLAEQLTMAGLEVDAVTPVAGSFEGVVVAEIVSAEQHPDADKLRVCTVNAGEETVQIVCGAPNVGKSAFISALSSGNMEVNHYPFTTKQIHVGHFTHRRLVHQLVDTPGLLDRPMSRRNAIEQQAIAALENIGSLVLFLLDTSEACGTPLDEQLNLLEDVDRLLPGTDMLVVTSKADLLNPRPEGWDNVHQEEEAWRDAGSKGAPELPLLYDEEGRPTMSATEEVGLDALRLEIVRRVKAAQPVDPMRLPEGWHRKDE